MIQRLTFEECAERIARIRTSLERHLGEKILLITSEGRTKKPIIGTLCSQAGKIFARYRHYTRNGSQRSQGQMYVNPALVHTGEIRVEYFDDGV